MDLIRNRIDKDGLPVGVAEPDLNDPHNTVERLKEGLINGE
jgi:hypothetical protein